MIIPRRIPQKSPQNRMDFPAFLFMYPKISDHSIFLRKPPQNVL